MIRLAEPEDGPALAELRWRWRTEEHEEKGVSHAEFVSAFGSWFHDHGSSHLTWLAETDDRVVGMAWLAVTQRVPGPGVWKRQAGVIQSVYVVPEARQGGMGAALVQAAIDRADELGLDYLEVHPSALSFPLYRRLGFSDTQRTLRLDLLPRQDPPDSI